jgi:hypothetical protein
LSHDNPILRQHTPPNKRLPNKRLAADGPGAHDGPRLKRGRWPRLTSATDGGPEGRSGSLFWRRHLVAEASHGLMASRLPPATGTA